MTTEIIRYRINAENAQAFEKAYQKAEPILQGSKHCLGYRLLRGHEEPENCHSMAIWAVFKSKGWVETPKKKK
jgi:quinol monooxygenase YgiN